MFLATGLDQSGEYFTDLHGEDGDLSSEEDIGEDVWSSEEDGGGEDTGQTPRLTGEEDEEEEAFPDEDRCAEEDRDSEGWGSEEHEDVSGDEANDPGQDVGREDGPVSEEDIDEDIRRGGESDGEEFSVTRRGKESSRQSAEDGGPTERQEEDYGVAEEDVREEDEDEEWYPMEDSRAADLRLELRSSAGLSAVSAPPAGPRHRRPASVSFSDRPPEAAPAPRTAVQTARAASAASRSPGGRNIDKSH